MRRSWLRLMWVGLIGVAAVVGYLVYLGPGERLLHREIETQLSRLLDGDVEIGDVELHFKGGMRVEARDLRAFSDPSGKDARPPALQARSVIARVDPVPLLVGRLELSELILETPFLRVEQDADGRFERLPLPAIEVGPLDAGPNELAEAFVTRIEGLDAAADAFFGGLQTANRIEIRDGTILWSQAAAGTDLDDGVDGDGDGDASTDASPPRREIRLEFVSTVFDSDWISDTVSLQWSAVFVDGQHPPFPFDLSVQRADGEAFDWNLSMSQLPIGTAQDFLPAVGDAEPLSGEISLDLRLFGEVDGPRRIALNTSLRNGAFRLPQSGSRIDRRKLTVKANFEISRERVRLTSGHIEGDRLGIDLKGSVRRPLKPSSAARLESRMLGVELDDLFSIARSFAGESPAARALTGFVEPVAGGRILFIEAGGTTSLSRWQRLLEGESRKLPKGFVFGGAFEGIRVAAGADEAIESLRGEVEWVGDRLTLRNTTADYRGAALPMTNISIEGISHLAQTPDLSNRSTAPPPPIPGLGALLELIKPRDPNLPPPVKAIGLAISSLEHPLLRWPFRDLRLLAEPLRSGIEVHVREGIWGEARVEGNVAFLGKGPDATVSAELTLSAMKADGVDRPKPSDSARKPRKRWGEGEFELEFRPTPQLPFQRATGFFRLENANLIANDIQFQIEPSGQLAARMVLDLSVVDQVGVDLSFALTGGELTHLNEFMALPPTLATGEFGATGTLKGPITPDTPLISRLDGRVKAEAKRGIIRMEVPLLLRLAKATEGYNPSADAGELDFETLTTTIDFAQGALLFPEFEIEGPLRVYANGRIDPLMRPSQCRAVVGIFLFRAPSQILETLPLVKYFLPGSERGLIGAYFKVKGDLGEPSVDSLPMATLMTAVPSAIKAPFKALQYLFDPSADDS